MTGCPIATMRVILKQYKDHGTVDCGAWTTSLVTLYQMFSPQVAQVIPKSRTKPSVNSTEKCPFRNSKVLPLHMGCSYRSVLTMDITTQHSPTRWDARGAWIKTVASHCSMRFPHCVRETPPVPLSLSNRPPHQQARLQ